MGGGNRIQDWSDLGRLEEHVRVAVGVEVAGRLARDGDEVFLVEVCFADLHDRRCPERLRRTHLCCRHRRRDRGRRDVNDASGLSMREVDPHSNWRGWRGTQGGRLSRVKKTVRGVLEERLLSARRVAGGIGRRPCQRSKRGHRSPRCHTRPARVVRTTPSINRPVESFCQQPGYIHQFDVDTSVLRINVVQQLP